ncbi:MAG TPA: hypothetical protein VEK15_25695, partial [Vicinamibacteria bacterium]|nr:hypothetical protein [Vicinamibacteria bacterium]
TEPQVRAAARAALSREVSTSVQIPAVRVLGEGRNEPAAARALEDLFAQDGISTSVLLAALESLAYHMETDAAPRALERALTPENSTSVQLKAIDVAAPHVARDPIRRAVAGALRSDNSTSVLLKAVQALGSQSAHQDVRSAFAATLQDDYSTSVVLASMAVLDGYVDSDETTKRAFVRLMEDEQMSYTARVRAGRRLLSSADDRLTERIADAMEDVVVRARRQGSSGHRQLIEEALDVLEAADPARWESLRGRSR